MKNVSLFFIIASLFMVSSSVVFAVEGTYEESPVLGAETALLSENGSFTAVSKMDSVRSAVISLREQGYSDAIAEVLGSANALELLSKSLVLQMNALSTASQSPDYGFIDALVTILPESIRSVEQDDSYQKDVNRAVRALVGLHQILLRKDSEVVGPIKSKIISALQGVKHEQSVIAILQEKQNSSNPEIRKNATIIQTKILQ